jgi:hypothetical protein
MGAAAGWPRRCAWTSDVRVGAGHRRLAWRAASSSISPRERRPSACIRAGRRRRDCAPWSWRARASRAAHRVGGHARVPARLRQHARRRWDKLVGGFGERWVATDDRFKPYACGTMIHPYIDCARRLAKKVSSRRRVVDHVRDGRRHRAPAVGAARHEAHAPERVRREVQHPVLRGLRAHGPRGPRGVHRSDGARPQVACSRRRWATRSIRRIPIPTNTPARARHA